jgi:hypothetical protein
MLSVAIAHHLLSACVKGKSTEDAVFTRPNGIPVRTLRDAWKRLVSMQGLDS